MSEMNLKLNILDFVNPEKPVKMFFSVKKGIFAIKSINLIPSEVKQHGAFKKRITKLDGDNYLFTCFDVYLKDSIPVEIDFNNPNNEDFVKAYYRWKLLRYFRQPQFNEIIISTDGITNDIQLWIKDKSATEEKVTYQGRTIMIKQFDRFTLKVRYDRSKNHPFLQVAYSSTSKLLGYSLADIFSVIERMDDPFTGTGSTDSYITPAHINRIMTCKTEILEDGKKNHYEKRIEKYTTLQKKNIDFDYSTSYPVLGKELKHFFHLDRQPPTRNTDSKYESYFRKITEFKEQYLQGDVLREVFHQLSKEFVSVNPAQLGKVDESKRMLIFGKGHKDIRQQSGINNGPYKRVPYTNVQLIFIFHSSNKDTAREVLKIFTEMKKIQYANPLSHYMGTLPISSAPKGLHIEFSDAKNPIPEIKAKLQDVIYRNLDSDVKYVGIYLSPINKYSSGDEEKVCYYKIKETFLNIGIPTQCMEATKIDYIINRGDNGLVYALQNMFVAICAKLGGAPWILAEPKRNELIIGVGAFKSDNTQFIGTTFSFDNTGLFNSYQYFQKNQLEELIGAIQLAIIKYASVNDRPNRLIIHYYKPMSLKEEFKPIEQMLNSLGLGIPIYVVTINKTEADDMVLFDLNSTYTDYKKQTQMSYMPYSGTYVYLGKNRQGGSTFILCNNTRYENGSFKSTDGFPFPVKLNISCPNMEGEMETPVINDLIGQVYQFSRIYYKSVKQQGLPVTIQYPSMIAEIMPYFDEKVVNVSNESLWFL